MKKFELWWVAAPSEEVIATTFYVAGSLVIFEKVTEQEDHTEFTPVLAVQASDITRIEYIGEDIE